MQELPSFEQARALVEQHARTLPRPAMEDVALLDADGRVLAQEVHADRDFPPFARATRDGFAVRATDVQSVPARLKVTSEIPAGATARCVLAAGEAAEIMTGAPMPDGADAVVMVEYSRREGAFVIVERVPKSADNFVPRASEAVSGALLLPTGSRMNPAAIAIAASVGKAKLNVYRRPEVAILATGDELVEVDDAPGPSQIRNSNSYSIAAQVAREGGRPRVLPITRDQEQSIEENLEAAKSADLIILSGGVSMGKYDLVEQVLAAKGARFHMTGARIQPGKPVVFGTLPLADRELPFFGLPGNPISTMVTFDLFVAPVLRALAGQCASALRFAEAKLTESYKTSPGLTRFLPANLSGSTAGAEVTLIPWHGSGDLAAIVRANCYLVVPPDTTSIASRSCVTILLKD